MRTNLLECMTYLLAVLTASPAAGAALIRFSGTVSYAGPYAVDTLYVAVVDTAGPTTIAYQVIPIGAPPWSVPFSIQFANAGRTGPVLLAALLDVDHSGFNPDSLDGAITPGDVLGWYAGNPDPALLDVSVSRTGLDFPLPTAEIHGNLVFAIEQPWAEIKAFSIPNHWSPPTLMFGAPGPYAIIGLYAGSWGVYGSGPYGSVCYGDPTCANPAVLTLAGGEVRRGVDLDFRITAVVPSSWGGIKQRYR
jgi:hypothetical protein